MNLSFWFIVDLTKFESGMLLIKLEPYNARFTYKNLDIIVLQAIFSCVVDLW